MPTIFAFQEGFFIHPCHQNPPFSPIIFKKLNNSRLFEKSNSGTKSAKKGSGEKEVDSLLKRIKLSIFLLLFLLLILLGCGGDGGGSGNDGGSDPGTGRSTGGGSSGIIELAWDSSPEPTVVGYKIYYGKASKAYDHTVDAGAATPFQDNGRSFQLSGLSPGQVYYISVKSYNSDNESDFSDEVSGVAR